MVELILQQVMNQGELFLRLVTACCLGGIIGVERKSRNKGAGMRTHALVCLGAALVMVVSKYGFMDSGSFDGSRMASQVVSGIGFLGAGIIFVRNHSISGVTTAAGIWVTSGVGLCIGAGQYFLAAAATFLVVAVQVILHKVGFLAKEPYRAILKVSEKGGKNPVKELQELLCRERIDIVAMKVQKSGGGEVKIELEVIYPAGYQRSDLIALLTQKEEITSVRG